MRMKSSYNRKQRRIRHFRQKRVNYAQRISDYYLAGGLAYISCNVSEYYDVINPYSVEGYEDLNEDFIKNVEENAKHIPVEYPIVLEICGGDFNSEQKKTIRETVCDYFALKLGEVQLEMEHNRGRIISTFIMGLCILLVLIAATRMNLYYAGCAVVLIVLEVFLEGVLNRTQKAGELIEEKTYAARMASIQVVFKNRFRDDDDNQSTKRAILQKVFAEEK